MILIIGGSSFIGLYAVNELINNNIDVAVTGRNKKFKKYYERLGIKYYSLDLTKKEDFDKLPTEGVDAVILLAGLLPANSTADLLKKDNSDEYFRVNTIGTINVLEYCRLNGISRIISAGSYADVQNSWRLDPPISEDEPRNYNYSGDHAAYVFSKNAANDMLRYYNEQYGMKNIWFRFPIVYGVGPHDSIFVNGKEEKSGLAIFIDNARTGKDINIYGNPKLSRDVVYVKDVAQAIRKATFSEKATGLYNITSGKTVTLEDQAKVIAKVWKDENHPESKIVYKPEISNKSQSYLFSIERAKSDFDYQPIFSDFESMMNDYKKDYYNNDFRELF